MTIRAASLRATAWMPTTAKCGIYSYMIRDAQRGLLDTIPANLLTDEAPVGDHIWESSRLFVAHDARRHPSPRTCATDPVGRNRGAAWRDEMPTLFAAAPVPSRSTCVGVKMKAMGPVMEIDAIDNQVVEMGFQPDQTLIAGANLRRPGAKRRPQNCAADATQQRAAPDLGMARKGSL